MFFFFCKQKTAYEMRISDWSSDVCSSDLAKSWNNRIEKAFSPKGELIRPELLRLGSTCAVDESASGRPSASAACQLKPSVAKISPASAAPVTTTCANPSPKPARRSFHKRRGGNSRPTRNSKIERASCRERMCTYVLIEVVGVSL